MQTFAKRLKEVRKDKNLSQQQMAKMLNIRQQSYARYELDTSEPSYEMLVKIAKFFNVTTDFLLGLTEY
ncbi:MAG: helix-turn-helix transcriptional regulator [Clostridia bacterium]|nr:helix-turn-helix transcriptional regulator [Clostridia bacterium]